MGIVYNVKRNPRITRNISDYNCYMDNETAAKLLQLNAEFYQTFAIQFSDTRQRIQPGVQRILDSIEPTARILDLGCGNGGLARELNRRGFSGQYIGLDFSAELIDLARNGIANNPGFSFINANLADPDWQSLVIIQSSGFDIIFAFAALHHLPGRDSHLRIFHAVRGLLTDDGRFMHSNWQFLNSDRLRKRIHPWEKIGLRDSDVDPGDYLLDWRRGGFGLRYAHHFSAEELNTLAADTGFRVIDNFYSDGETQDLGLYQVWMVDD